MIDPTARDELRRSLQAFATGRISGDQFLEVEERIKSSGDPGVEAVFEHFAELVDDFGPQYLRGKHRLTGELRKAVARSILFLKGGREYEWPPRSGDFASCFASLALTALLVGAAFFLALGALLRSDHLRFNPDGGWGVGNFQLTLGIFLGTAFVKLLFWTRKHSRDNEAEWNRHGDADVWPYLTTSQLDEDRRAQLNANELDERRTDATCRNNLKSRPQAIGGSGPPSVRRSE